MIKAPFTIAELDVMAEDFYKEIQKEFAIMDAIGRRAVDEASPVFDYLRIHLKSIITGQPKVLEGHICHLTGLVTNTKAQYRHNNPQVKPRGINTWFKNEILKIFNYDYNNNSFTKKDNGKLAYDHAKKLNFNTCLYCNAQFTFTIRKESYKMRPHFDHFINKAKHPYFALSFYNLVPACYVCNSSLKGAKLFNVSTHIHPFLEGIDGSVEFVTKVDTVDYLVNKTSFTLTAIPCKGADIDKVKRIKKSLKDFAIEDRYGYHKDYVAEIITKAYIYNNSTIHDLLETFHVNGQPIFNGKAEIVEMLLGNVVQKDHLHQRILSKIVKDIAKEVGLLV